jgi:hypothetical protein
MQNGKWWNFDEVSIEILSIGQISLKAGEVRIVWKSSITEPASIVSFAVKLVPVSQQQQNYVNLNWSVWIGFEMWNRMHSNVSVKKHNKILSMNEEKIINISLIMMTLKVPCHEIFDLCPPPPSVFTYTEFEVDLAVSVTLPRQKNLSPVF